MREKVSSDIHGRLGRLRASGKTAAATEKDPFKLSQALSTQSPASSQSMFLLVSANDRTKLCLTLGCCRICRSFFTGSGFGVGSACVSHFTLQNKRKWSLAIVASLTLKTVETLSSSVAGRRSKSSMANDRSDGGAEGATPAETKVTFCSGSVWSSVLATTSPLEMQNSRSNSRFGVSTTCTASRPNE